MEKEYIVALKDALVGDLPKKTGIYRLLIDEERNGAKHFTLMVNTMKAGIKGVEHNHDVEHCWYILSGKGTMYMEGESMRIEPEMAVFAPATVFHRIDVDPEEDLTYVLIYAPPGPEKELKRLGADAYGSK